MTALTEPIREALTAGRLAHVVTVNPDGSPQVSIVWMGIEDDEIVIATLGDGHRTRNLARDPRVVISVELDGKNEVGLNNYLVIRGTARITDGGAADLLHRLAQIYIGPGTKFPPMDDPPPGRVVHIAVDRVSGVSPWT